MKPKTQKGHKCMKVGVVLQLRLETKTKDK